MYIYYALPGLTNVWIAYSYEPIRFCDIRFMPNPHMALLWLVLQICKYYIVISGLSM